MPVLPANRTTGPVSSGVRPRSRCCVDRVSSFSPATALAEGSHSLTAVSTDQAGNVDDVNGNVDNPNAPNALDPSDGVPAAYEWTVGATPVTKTVFCGQKITQSIIVNNNLADCLGHGLIVGASGITIDLNGKTIDGKSIGAAILNNGFDSVTIKNGRLMDFDYGVMLNNGAALNIVEGVTAELNQEAAISLGHGTFPEDPTLAPSEPVPGFQSGVDGTILRSNNAGCLWSRVADLGPLVIKASAGVAFHAPILRAPTTRTTSTRTSIAASCAPAASSRRGSITTTRAA